MSVISYTELARALGDAGSDVAASEAHGCLCGALCADESLPAAEWAAEILPDEEAGPLPADSLDLLDAVRRDTLDSLAGGDMTFQPMLPLDSGSLDSRVRALAAWCSGFLYGLGRLGGGAPLPGDLEEILADFSEISRAVLAEDDQGEEAERNYAELVEFVRASVLLAWEELGPRRSGPAVAPPGAH